MKKFVYTLLIILLIAPLGFAFSACKKTYSVKFIVDSRAYKVVSVNPGESISRIDDPQKDGYIFDGWYFSEKNDAQKFSFDLATISSNIVLYARWSKSAYTIVYKNMEGAVNNTNNPSAYSVETPTFTLQDPFKENYVFDGWYKNSDFSDERVTTIYTGSTGDLFLYAKWIPQSFNLTYSLNGGENDSRNPSSYTIENSVHLAPAMRENYNFEGWYTDVDLNYGPIDTIALGSSGNKTLYAKWSIKNYNITYNLNGGENDSRNPDTYTFADNNITFYNPTRNGYRFLGWFNSEGMIVTHIPSGSSGDIEIFASWQTENYAIVYMNVNGATNPSSNPVSYTIETPTITLSNPSKLAYIFQGWYSNERFTGAKVTQIASGSQGIIYLYAKWDAYQYRITYVLNGGTNSDENVATFTYEDEVTLFAPTREGYTFGGWYLRSDFGGEPITEIPYGTHEGIQIYAKWIEN